MKKLSVFLILFLLFGTLTFAADIREPQRMERITREVIKNAEFGFPDHAEKNEETKSWIKRQPVIAGTLIGFGAGAFLGQASNGDYSVFGKVIWFGGIGAGVGAVVGKVASEY